VVKEMPDLKGGFPHIALHVDSQHFEETIDALKSVGVPFVMERCRSHFGVPVRRFCMIRRARRRADRRRPLG
jgi:hypothetical protein